MSKKQAMRDRLRDLHLSITDIQRYLRISRPTVYKYMDYYDAGEVSKIKTKVYLVFKFIDEHPEANKFDALNYMTQYRVEESSIYANFIHELRFIKFFERVTNLDTAYDNNRLLRAIDQELNNQEYEKKKFH